MSRLAMRYTELVYRELSAQVDALKRELRTRTSETNDNVFAFADLPDTSSMSSFEIFFVTDGLKEGETTGNGSGVVCYFDVASSSYLRLSDNAIVST